MAGERSLGYIFNTGAATGDKTRWQHLVTIDAPTAGSVIHSCLGPQGLYFLTHDTNESLDNIYGVYVLPQPDNLTQIKYADASKMTYRWKSKKFVMAGRTTWGAAKVVHDSGCVKLRLYIDGCCRHEEVVKGCGPFRLPGQLAGIEAEIELVGTARVYEVHIASSIQELLRNE